MQANIKDRPLSVAALSLLHPTKTNFAVHKSSPDYVIALIYLKEAFS